jgi:hypothetical protein
MDATPTRSVAPPIARLKLGAAPLESRAFASAGDGSALAFFRSDNAYDADRRPHGTLPKGGPLIISDGSSGTRPGAASASTLKPRPLRSVKSRVRDNSAFDLSAPVSPAFNTAGFFTLPASILLRYLLPPVPRRPALFQPPEEGPGGPALA